MKHTYIQLATRLTVYSRTYFQGVHCHHTYENRGREDASPMLHMRAWTTPIRLAIGPAALHCTAHPCFLFWRTPPYAKRMRDRHRVLAYASARYSASRCGCSASGARGHCNDTVPNAWTFGRWAGRGRGSWGNFLLRTRNKERKHSYEKVTTVKANTSRDM